MKLGEMWSFYICLRTEKKKNYQHRTGMLLRQEKTLFQKN